MSTEKAMPKMDQSKFRKELGRIMPGYNWTVHRNEIKESDFHYLEATGIQSAGFNRMSTLSVKRREKDGRAKYEVKSSGFGMRSPWLAIREDVTLASALRRLQNHYESVAANYASHARALQYARKNLVKAEDKIAGEEP